MLAAFVTLLDRQMLFVTGKGGVGKTTVATALGLASARSGRRTIVCELAGQARVPDLLDRDAGAPGEEVRLGDALWHTTIVSYQVMEQWIGRILGSRRLTALLTHSNFFRAFAEAAPGGMELGTIVKTWELAQEERWDKRHHVYDVVIVDGPASGHAVGMLSTPATFADIARVGPIASQSARVRDWLRDGERTGYVAVALAEELPVSETIDLGDRLDRAIGRRLEGVILNGVLPDRFSGDELARVEAAAPAEVSDAVRAADARAGAQREQIERLESGIDAPVADLPFVFTDHLRRRDVEAMAELLAV
jgi:anion-transporting  ArsA/GET3 family ATPase